jgi:hypothetical protein
MLPWSLAFPVYNQAIRDHHSGLLVALLVRSGVPW